MDDQYTRLELELLTKGKNVVSIACEGLLKQSPAKNTPLTYRSESVSSNIDSSGIDDEDQIPLGLPVMME